MAFILTLYHIEMPFNTFANRADPDKAVIVRADHAALVQILSSALSPAYVLR